MEVNMTHSDSPIVQAEFFHRSKFKAVSLDEVFNEWRGGQTRLARQTTLRFNDNGLVLHRCAREARLERLEEELRPYALTNGFWHLWFKMRHASVLKNLKQLRSSRVEFMANQVADMLHNERAILIRDPNLSFRLIRLNERHEVLEAIRGAPEVWIFLFAHNDLEAPTQRVLGLVT